VEVSVSGAGLFALGQLHQPSDSPAPTTLPSPATTVPKSIWTMASTAQYLYRTARTLLGCTDRIMETVFPFPVLAITPSPPPSPSFDAAAEAVMAPSKLACHPYCFGWWLIYIQSTGCSRQRTMSMSI
jgi:hypothetical protein